MGERLLCKQEVIGSIPFTSTNFAPYLNAACAPFGSVKMNSAGCRHGTRCLVLFDIVKRSEPNRTRFVQWHDCGVGSVAEKSWVFVTFFVLTKRERRLSPVHGNPMTQAREGHLVDALALRGDEGRSTLR